MTDSLSTLMRSMYDERHPADGRIGKLKSRKLQTGGIVDLEVFFSGMRRQEYERKNEVIDLSRQRGEQIPCRLCFPSHSLVYRCRLAITPDEIPFFPYHMLLRPITSDAVDTTLKSLGPHLELGLVEERPLDCRPGFTYEDIVAMSWFVKDAQDYMVTQSFGGSGASVPEHVHAHAFPKNETDFPFMRRACFTNLRGTNSVWVNRHITYAILVKGSPETIAKVFVSLNALFRLPANHCFKVDDDFGGLIGIYVPRIRDLPQVPSRLRKANWKFGAFEVLGLYDAKNEELYDSLRLEEAYAATRSVTLHHPERQKEIEKAVQESVLKSGRGVEERLKEHSKLNSRRTLIGS